MQAICIPSHGGYNGARDRDRIRNTTLADQAEVANNVWTRGKGLLGGGAGCRRGAGW